MQYFDHVMMRYERANHSRTGSEWLESGLLVNDVENAVHNHADGTPLLRVNDGLESVAGGRWLRHFSGWHFLRQAQDWDHVPPVLHNFPLTAAAKDAYRKPLQTRHIGERNRNLCLRAIAGQQQ